MKLYDENKFIIIKYNFEIGQIYMQDSFYEFTIDLDEESYIRTDFANNVGMVFKFNDGKFVCTCQ